MLATRKIPLSISMDKKTVDDLWTMFENDQYCTNFSQLLRFVIQDGLKYQKLSNIEKNKPLPAIEVFQNQVEEVFLQHSQREIEDFILFLGRKHKQLAFENRYRWQTKESRERLQLAEQHEQERLAYVRS